MVFPINLSILDMNYFISKFLKVYVQIVTFFNLPQKTIVDVITSLMFIAELGQIFLSFLRVLAEAELSVAVCCPRQRAVQASSNPSRVPAILQCSGFHLLL